MNPFQKLTSVLEIHQQQAAKVCDLTTGKSNYDNSFAKPY